MEQLNWGGGWCTCRRRDGSVTRRRSSPTWLAGPWMDETRCTYTNVRSWHHAPTSAAGGWHCMHSGWNTACCSKLLKITAVYIFSWFCWLYMQKFVVNKPVRPEQLASQKNIWHELYRAMLEVVVLKFIPCFTLECPCGSCSRILLAAGAPAVKRGAWMGEMLLLLDDIFHFKIIYTFSCMILARSRASIRSLYITPGIIFSCRVKNLAWCLLGVCSQAFLDKRTSGIATHVATIFSVVCMYIYI